MSAIATAATLPGYARPAGWGDLPLVDADVRLAAPVLAQLTPYLERRWVDYIAESGMGGLASALHPHAVPGVFLPGTAPAGGLPGSDPEVMRAQLLEPWRVGRAVASCGFAVDALRNDDLAAALAAAVNRWQQEVWLGAEPRLAGSAVLPTQNIDLAVAEIERVAQDPRFVQVLLPVRSREPYGRRSFLPILRAASEAGLVVALQPGGVGGQPTTPVGWPTSYTEDYVDLSLAFQAQVVSLLCEGPFVVLPELRVVCLEAGFTWLPPLLWRLDKNWKGLRREVPWVRELPSQLAAQHLRFVAQPLDSPEDPALLLEVLDQLESDELLLFGSGYPLQHFTEAEQSVPQGLGRDALARLLADNAAATYRFV